MSGWVAASLWGLLAGSALVLGTVLTLLVELPHRLIAAIMAFGSGAMLSVLGTELMADSVKIGGLTATLAGFATGAAVFSGTNWLLSKRGAKHRNRCGDCVEQSKESQLAGSGLAIALGALLDGVPESLIVGLGAKGGQANVAVVLGFFLANFPQGLSSASGMKQAGRGTFYVLSIWCGIALASGVAAGVGNLMLGGLAPQMQAIVKAFAAGAVVAMLAETMIPEAFEKAPSFIGLITAAGFFAAFLASNAL